MSEPKVPTWIKAAATYDPSSNARVFAAFGLIVLITAVSVHGGVQKYASLTDGDIFLRLIISCLNGTLWACLSVFLLFLALAPFILAYMAILAEYDRLTCSPKDFHWSAKN